MNIEGKIMVQMERNMYMDIHLIWMMNMGYITVQYILSVVFVIHQVMKNIVTQDVL